MISCLKGNKIFFFLTLIVICVGSNTSVHAENTSKSGNSIRPTWHDLSSWNRIVKYLTGSNDCKTKIYPSLSTIDKRRQNINKNMVLAHCVGAWSEYCSTILEMKHLPQKEFNLKLMSDFKFFKDVMTIDLHSAFLEKTKDKNELYYYAYINTMLQKMEWVEDKISRQATVETVFVGDSLMHIFDEVGKEHFPNAAFMGIAGDRTDSMLFRLSHMVLALKPKNVVISISGNDLNQECKLQNIDYNRKLIVKFLKMFGVENIYWVSIPPTLLPGMINSIQIENEKISKENDVVYLDTFTPMAGPNRLYKEEYISRDGNKVDLIHFNLRGYNEVWIPIFKALGL